MCVDKYETLLIWGKGVRVDACIAPLVLALNAAGLVTVASCCGHGNRWGSIILEDGRELIIAPDYESARAFDVVHGREISDERRALLKKEEPQANTAALALKEWIHNNFESYEFDTRYGWIERAWHAAWKIASALPCGANNNARDETTPELLKCSQCSNYVRGVICAFTSCGLDNGYKDFKGVASPVA